MEIIPDVCKACTREINPDEEAYIAVGIFADAPSGEAAPQVEDFWFYHRECFPKGLSGEIESLRLRYR